MIRGDRIESRRKEIGISQAELARRVGIGQSSMHAIIAGGVRDSRHLLKIARELRSSPAYLIGETDDPDDGTPPPPPEPVIRLVSMPVALPSDHVLARMFEGMLETVDLAAPKADIARTLAKRLPTGLSRLRGLLVEPEAATAGIDDEEPEAPPAPLRAGRQGPST